MARAFLSLLAMIVIGGAALSLGLVGTTLRTGRINPLDWLLPGTVSILLLMLFFTGPRTALRSWVIVTVPIMALIAMAGTHLPWLGMLLLGCGLSIVTLIAWVTRTRSRGLRVGASVALVIVSFLAPRMGGMLPPAALVTDRPLIGIFTAMPLQGIAMGAAHGLPPLESVGLRSPLWIALEQHVRPQPVDALDDATLAVFSTLLVAQPRLLAPDELVAFDAWVRRGGRAVILADPLLHWPDPRPLGHAARAPLTSLLDPLLSHWGVRLEPVDQSADVEKDRRALTSGALLQLAGASRFSAAKGRDCLLSEDGLIARCSIGAGQALLVADADWVNDMLWTLHPDRLADRSGWTSDAPDQLAAWLRGSEFRVDPRTSWLVDEASLVAGLRTALLLLLVLIVGGWLVVRRPSLSQPVFETEVDHSWNKKHTESDSR